MNAFYQALKISKVTKETDCVKTFEFNAHIDAQPGQFVMAWIPKYGEKPFGVACTKLFTLTVFNRGGKFTKKMHSLKKGEKVWVRGPFGSGFHLPKKARKILLVAGGYGAIPLFCLAQKAIKQKIKTTVVLGAKQARDLVFEKRFKKIGCQVFVSTNDGSKGFKGLSTDVARGLMTGENFDAVYSCGPELMMKKLAKTCANKKIPIQCSLERYIKCGLGVCGQCAIDGLLVCKDGPVFDGKTTLKLKEFGKAWREPTGKLRYYT